MEDEEGEALKKLLLPFYSSIENYPNRTTVAVLECRQGFYRENGSNICIPSCHTWLLYRKGLSIFIDVVIFTCAFVGCFACAAVITISFLSRKRMLSFPSIFIVYIVFDLLALSIFVMVNYMDRNKLFCSSRSLIESLRVVTPFCVISGILFTYVLDQLAFWCLFHTISLFWKVKFPFHARAFEISGKVKYIHITCVILGIMFPLIPIITTMADFAVDVQKQNENSTFQLRNSLFLSGGLGFRSTRSPSILCTATSQAGIFYSLVLPMDIILGFIATMIIIIFWSVHRQNMNLMTNQSINPFKFGTAEKKLIIVFFYYELLASVALTTFTLGTRNASQIVNTVQSYFICEQGGHDPGHPCSRSEIEDEELTYPSLTTLSYILLALFPVVNLVYVVNIGESKELWRKWFPNKKTMTTNNPSTGSNVVIPLTSKRVQ